MPRHPPCALSSLSCYKDARVHCVVLKLRADSPTDSRLLGFPSGSCLVKVLRFRLLDPSGPNSVPGPIFVPILLSTPCGSTCQLFERDEPNNRRSTSEQCSPLDIRQRNEQAWTDKLPEMLLRKEVIQPHLPVRLPCYDFVPIASPTFDSSFPCGLGHRLRVLPTFVT